MRLLFFILILFQIGLKAQTPFDKKASIQEGFYRNFKELKDNQPSISFGQLTNLDYVLNAEENVLILSEATQNELNRISDQAIWGLSIKDKVYIRTQDKENGRYYFVHLHVMGKISYYYYKAFRDKIVTMYVHNPYTGERIGQRNITNKERVSVERILHFETGESLDYSHENLVEWTKDDLGLNKSIKSLTKEELDEKLFKSLLIYNDRNKVYFNTNP
jgi:hypothetical protein